MITLKIKSIEEWEDFGGDTESQVDALRGKFKEEILTWSNMDGQVVGQGDRVLGVDPQFMDTEFCFSVDLVDGDLEDKHIIFNDLVMLFNERFSLLGFVFSLITVDYNKYVLDIDYSDAEWEEVFAEISDLELV